MPEPVAVKPRLVDVPIDDVREGDVAIVQVGPLDRLRAKIVNEVHPGELYGAIAVYRLTPAPDPRAADAEALDRLDRWMRQQSTGARVSVEFTPSFAGGEEFFEAELTDSIVELRGTTTIGKGPTLAAAINAALDAAGAGK